MYISVSLTIMLRSHQEGFNFVSRQVAKLLVYGLGFDFGLVKHSRPSSAKVSFCG